MVSRARRKLRVRSGGGGGGVTSMAARKRRRVAGLSFPASTMACRPVLREPDSQMVTALYHTSSAACETGGSFVHVNA